MLPLMVSFVMAFGLLVWLQRADFFKLALDHPNHRSLHVRAVPRTGGLALMGGMLTGWMLQRIPDLGILLPAILFLIIISFLDDLRGMPIVLRFLVHFLAAGIFAGLMLDGLNTIEIMIVTFAMVWMTNLYNFMDGSDGLAGGMALFGFGFYGLAAWLHGDAIFAWMNWNIVAATLAFLCFNFHPARIFMGDAGSIPLGFLAAALGLLGWHNGAWPLWFPVLVFSPFIVDATVTLAKRLFRGEKVWRAHREHYYQRLVQMGWGHRKTAITEYVLMLAAGGSAVWAIGLDGHNQQRLAWVWVLIYVGIMWLVDKHWAAANKIMKNAE